MPGYGRIKQGIAMDILTELNTIEEKFGLEKRALEGLLKWIDNNELDIAKSVSALFKYQFKSHKFCFKHADLPYQFIETTFDIHYQGDHVGYYKLFTTLDGKSVDDALVITDDNLKH